MNKHFKVDYILELSLCSKYFLFVFVTYEDSQVCREWEGTALEVNQDVRLALIRIGVVLGKDGGALGTSFLKPSMMCSWSCFFNWDFEFSIVFHLDKHEYQPIFLASQNLCQLRDWRGLLQIVINRPKSPLSYVIKLIGIWFGMYLIDFAHIKRVFLSKKTYFMQTSGPLQLKWSLSSWCLLVDLWAPETNGIEFCFISLQASAALQLQFWCIKGHSFGRRRFTFLFWKSSFDYANLTCQAVKLVLIPNFYE